MCIRDSIRPVPTYTAWWTEAHGCEKLAQSFCAACQAETRTHNLLITSPTLYRQRHNATNGKRSFSSSFRELIVFSLVLVLVLVHDNITGWRSFHVPLFSSVACLLPAVNTLPPFYYQSLTPSVHLRLSFLFPLTLPSSILVYKFAQITWPKYWSLSSVQSQQSFLRHSSCSIDALVIDASVCS